MKYRMSMLKNRFIDMYNNCTSRTHVTIPKVFPVIPLDAAVGGVYPQSLDITPQVKKNCCEKSIETVKKLLTPSQF